jgi:GAF domain-containing protein
MNASSRAAFGASYEAAFHAFLAAEDENGLHNAYQLGREAVSDQIGLLELAHAHHAALMSAVAGVSETTDAQRVTRAAADFLLEALSAYEIVHRGFAEARETVASQRQQARMIRQLSTLLADASLALHTHSSVEEMLQLVAEQTRELTRAAWCVTHGHTASARQSAALAYARCEPPDALKIAAEAYSAFDSGTPTAAPVRLEMTAPGEAIAIPLTTLDGENVGLLAIGAHEQRPFTDLDHALLRHIGQMTAAALERAMRYGDTYR